MAQKVVVSLVSDLSGLEHTEDAPVDTVGFGLDGVGYELELTETEQARLRELLAPYIAAARRLGRSPVTKARRRRRATGASASTAPRSDREQARAMRQWARRHGLAVSERGRVPGHVRDAYHRNDPALATARGATSRAEVNAGALTGGAQPEQSPTAAPKGSHTQDERIGRDGLTRTRREAIRTWAKVQGMDVKDKGILKKETILDANAWENTHGSLEVTPAESATR